MAEASSAQNSKQNIVQQLIDVGTKAFDPAANGATRAAGHQKYNELLEEYGASPQN